MRPFYEHENEKNGRKERIYWDADRSQEKLMEFVNEAKDFMNARDIERARSAGIELPEDAKYLPTIFPDANGNYVVNPIAASIKHSGAETTDRWKPRWEAFCCSPQSDEHQTYPKPTYVPKQPPRGAVPVQEKTAVVAYDVPAPKRGRPRKQQMQEI